MDLANELAAVGLSWAQLEEIHDGLAERFFQDGMRDEGAPPDLIVVGIDGKRSPSLALSPEQVGSIFVSEERTEAWLMALFTEGHPLHNLFKTKLGAVPRLVLQFEETQGFFLRSDKLEAEQTALNSRLPEESYVVTLHTAPVSIQIAHPILRTPKKTCSFQSFPSIEDYVAAVEYEQAMEQHLPNKAKFN